MIAAIRRGSRPTGTRDECRHFAGRAECCFRAGAQDCVYASNYQNFRFPPIGKPSRAESGEEAFLAKVTRICSLLG